MNEFNYNCRGCGALLSEKMCPYCARPLSPGDLILPRGYSSNHAHLHAQDDPKRKIEPRAVRY